MTRNPIDDAAIDWIVRLDRGEMSPQDSERLDQWLSADRRHQGAFVRAQAAWHGLDRVRAIGSAGLAHSSIRPDRRRFLAGALAASVTGLMAGPAAWPRMRLYSTEPGEVRRIPLPDGSMAILNSGTAMTVQISATVRKIRLLHGEAWFYVAHDRSRPFLVRADQTSVRAVGTAFSVALSGDETDVMVTQGVVATRTGWSGELHQSAGSFLRARANGMRTLRTLDQATLNARLAWRSLEIVLSDETLAQAVRQFNRYNRQKLRITDPALGDERVTGWFRLDDPTTFARAVALTLGAEIRTDADSIILAAPPSDEKKSAPEGIF